MRSTAFLIIGVFFVGSAAILGAFAGVEKALTLKAAEMSALAVSVLACWIGLEIHRNQCADLKRAFVASRPLSCPNEHGPPGMKSFMIP